MGAKNSTSAAQNYYGISYGYLSTGQANIPAGKDEISEAKLKALMQKFENLDLRNAYVKKDGSHPYKVFYQTISGTVTDIEKVQTDNYGFQLRIKMIDDDSEISIINVKFYNKYVENFLNRLININSNKLSLSPYSIPSEYEGKRFYNQGVVVYEDGSKVGPAIESKDLPQVEEVTNADGTTSFSRVKRIDFIWKKAMEKWEQINKVEPSPVPASVADSFLDDEDDGGDLPF